MSAKRFEEQVREKMDELKFSPSPTVWSGVEAELDRRRKRRFIYWWTAPAAALVLIGSLLLNNSFDPSARGKEMADSKTSLQTKQHSEQKSSLSIEPVVTGQTKEQTESTNRPAEPNLTAEISQSRPVILKNSTTSTTSVNYRSGNAPRNEVEMHSTSKELPVQLSVVEDPLKTAKPGNIIRISSLGSISAKPLELTETKPAAAPIKKPLTNWSYGFNASAGIAGVYDRNLIRQTTQSPSSAMLPPNFTNITYRSAVVEPGSFYSVGAFLERPINKKFSVTGALNYTRYSSYLRIGSRIDEQRTINPGSRDSSRINYYYSPDPKYRYQMHHSMVEIPVTIRFSKRWFSVNAGVTGSAVVTSDMLVFDPTSGIYYKDRDNMNRFMFGLTGGFEVSVFRKAKHPLQVGPVIRYQVSDITSQYSDSRHLLSGALQARWYLQK